MRLCESLLSLVVLPKYCILFFFLSHHSEKSREGFVLLQLIGFGFPVVLSLTGGGKGPAHLSNGQLVQQDSIFRFCLFSSFFRVTKNFFLTRMTFDICSECNISQQIVCLSLYLLSVQRHPWQSSTVVSIKDTPVATFLVHILLRL